MKKLITLLILTVIASSAFCKTITVTSSANSGTGTLRQAVLDAADNDTILFEDSVSSIILLTQIDIEKNITVIGDSINSTILIMNGNGTVKARHISISDSIEVLMCNLTLQDNYANCDGGALASAGTLTLRNCIFKNNRSNYSSGAVLSYGEGELYAFNCIFENNYSSGIGGAIRCANLAYFETCLFANNTGSSGGALYFKQEGLLEIIDSEFRNNSASFGGAIYNYGNIEIKKSSFIDNSAIYSSAAIGSTGNLVILDSFFENNESVSAGVISNEYLSVVNSNPTITIINCLLLNNRLTNNDDSQSSSILENNQNGTLSVVNSTIINNTAIPIVGNGTISLYNNILWNNTQNSGDLFDIYLSDTTKINCYNNIIGNINTSLLNSTNYIDIDPILNLDYSLPANSPAVDAGYVGKLNDSVFTDIIGNSRLSGKSIDIGAYEYQQTTTNTSTSPSMLYKIYSFNKHIIVENNSEKADIFNLNGDLIDSGNKSVFPVPQTGIYLVKIGMDTQKVIVK